ncbi:siroheme synthase [Crucibulum laeve]|uniref:precorrin-2 dehydrogenase n=1 Tax=Crucibulum laeve TaxID=68775 RepID=A0A5C3MAY2_9AGAR|nr:siroheme synthase [Crucibulum laeve]
MTKFLFTAMTTTPEGALKHIGGGSLLIAWQLDGKRVLIVGGGVVASQRIESILTTDASIFLLAPSDGLIARTRRLIELYPDHVSHLDRTFSGPEEIHNMDMVLTAIDDAEKSRQIVLMCRAAKIPVNAADIPDLCDFYFGSQIRDGPLQIMVSTNGKGPKLTALIKNRVQESLAGVEGDAIMKVGALRKKLKERAPGIGGPIGQQRMKWMSAVCEQWKMTEFTQLDEEMIEKLLDEGWNKKRVPTIEEVGGYRLYAEDGASFPLNVGLSSIIAFCAGAIVTVSVFILRQRR